jgi:hypothetical protein
MMSCTDGLSHCKNDVACITAVPSKYRRLGSQNFVLLFWLLLLSYAGSASGQVNVYTRSYDNGRNGANLQETILTPANVNPTSFGKLFTVPTDGEVYAQPLYVSNLTIAGGQHNVVYVATMLNSIYALDADTGALLWTKNFGTPIAPEEVDPNENISYSTGVGILGTPVIDPESNVMYFVSSNEFNNNNVKTYEKHLNAIDIVTGLPVSASPVNITASYSTSDLVSPIVFNAMRQNQRAGLAIANGNIYIAFSSHSDIQPYHGWVLAYNKSTLAQTAVYSDTTVGIKGGIWNAGQAPAVDSNGNLYLSTGNGSFGRTPNGLVETGNSIIKLSPTLELLDYFTPSNSAALNADDQDLGSSGLLLLPNTNYVLGGGKQGVLYLLDANGMGGFNASDDQVRQEFQSIYGKGTSHIHGTPAYFDNDLNGPTIYIWGENDVLRALLFNATTGLLNTTPYAMSTMTAPVTNNYAAMPGGFVSISANGKTNGILWASTPYDGDAARHVVQGVLYAFDADTLKPLWSDKTNDTRDEIGRFSKFCPPLVVNGKMYVPNFGPNGTTDGSGSLVVYGLLQPISTKTTLTSSATQATTGASIALTATVAASSGSSVSVGTVNFYNGTTLLGSVGLSGATATLNTTALPVGTSSLTATFVGDSNFEPSTSPGIQVTVTPALAVSTTTTLTSSTTQAAQGASIALTATVAVASGASIPTGPVNFYNGTTLLGSVGLSGATATLNTTALPVGTNSLTATFVGDSNFEPSTSPGIQVTVAPALAVSTTTTLTSSTTQAAQGASIALTATVAVASGASIPTGPVNFYNGTTLLGSANLSGATATLSTTTLPVGTNSIMAQYEGSTAFTASTSAAITVIIVQPDFTMIAAPAAITVKSGTVATTTINITPVNGFNQSVGFSCSGLPMGSSCSFGTSVLNADGTSSVPLNINTAANNTTATVDFIKRTNAILLVLLPYMITFPLKRTKAFRTAIGAAVTVLTVTVCLGTTGCGSEKTEVPSAPTNTTATTSTVIVTGTASSGTIHTATVLLTVN